MQERGFDKKPNFWGYHIQLQSTEQRDLLNLSTGIILSIRWILLSSRSTSSRVSPERCGSMNRTMQWPGQHSYDKFPSSFMARMPAWNGNILHLPLTFTGQMQSSSICITIGSTWWVSDKKCPQCTCISSCTFSDFRTESATPPWSVFQDDIFIFMQKKFFFCLLPYAAIHVNYWKN